MDKNFEKPSKGHGESKYEERMAEIEGLTMRFDVATAGIVDRSDFKKIAADANNNMGMAQGEKDLLLLQLMVERLELLGQKFNQGQTVNLAEFNAESARLKEELLQNEK